MLSRILDSHGRVACPFEFAVPSLLGRGHWKFKAATMKAAVIAEHYHAPVSWVMPPPLVPERWTGSIIRRRLNEFAAAVCRQENKELFVIKEPAHHEVADRITQLHGLESLILLSRGPLATASSLSNTFADKDPLRTWAQAHANIDRLAKSGALLVRYEDLVADPAAQAQRVCGTLGIEFEEAMLNFGEHRHTDDELKLWYKDSSSRQLVSAQESQMHQTVTKGFVDKAHNMQRLRELPAEVLDAYRNNAHGARELAARFGYDELAQLDADPEGASAEDADAAATGANRAD